MPQAEPEIIIPSPGTARPVERCWALSMTVTAFKGRRDVDVHLFRHKWSRTEAETLLWSELIGPPLVDSPLLSDDPDSSRRVLLESFTTEERDRIVAFLRTTYLGRLTRIASCPLSFPIPAGLVPLSDIRPGKTVGLVDFARIQRYTLDIPLRGLFDLAQHKPLMDRDDAETAS